MVATPRRSAVRAPLAPAWWEAWGIFTLWRGKSPNCAPTSAPPGAAQRRTARLGTDRPL
jgi:hypothetical protein